MSAQKPYYQWVNERNIASLAKSYGFYAGVAWLHASMIQDAPDCEKENHRKCARYWAKQARLNYRIMQDRGLMTNPLHKSKSENAV